MALNQNLQAQFEQIFKPQKLVAYSNCCRYGCCGSYAEGDAEFEARDKGIFFIRLHLNGMNYNPHPDSCYAQYQDHAYLMQNWDTEHGILAQWCGVLGLAEGEFTIHKPANEREAIRIDFGRPLNLDEPVYEDSGEEDNNDPN